jgi:hypothetical protein
MLINSKHPVPVTDNYKRENHKRPHQWLRNKVRLMRKTYA